MTSNPTEDIQLAADVLRPAFDDSDGANGFVSLEVSPGSAHDTGASIAEARHLWQVAARRNVMIKVPVTPEGVPAVEVLTAEGTTVPPATLDAFRDHGIRLLVRSLVATLGRKRSEILTTAS